MSVITLTFLVLKRSICCDDLLVNDQNPHYLFITVELLFYPLLDFDSHDIDKNVRSTTGRH